MKTDKFITADTALDKPPFRSSSLLFRRTFILSKKQEKYVLKIAGLGMGVYYLNGHPVTDSVLNQAFSDYRKTIWVNYFDVTSLIQEGKNVLSVQLGNGFYNESIVTTWHIEQAPWRNEKMLYVSLLENQRVILTSDTEFRYQYSLFTTYNELRGGECVDFNHYEDFMALDYDDSSWHKVVFTSWLKEAKLRKLECPLMKEYKRYTPCSIVKNNEGYLVDFGINMSGYVEISLKGEKGQVVTLKFAEDHKENELDLHGLDCYHTNERFQENQIICDGRKDTFKPQFCYFGFRYMQISGYTGDIHQVEMTAIFTHQDLKMKAHKPCRDEMSEKLFQAGIRSTLSNTYWVLTDCPTREKLGWGNDAQVSMPQFMQNFDARTFCRKWMQDIADSVKMDGSVPGIFPSPDWGFDYGPMMCGALVITLPYFYEKYYHSGALYPIASDQMIRTYYFYKRTEPDGFLLGDWTGCTNHPDTPKPYVYNLLMYCYSYIMYHHFKNSEYQIDMNFYRHNLEKTEPDGQCICSSLLVLHLGNRKKNIAELKKAVLKSHYHIDCGTVGTSFLFRALKENHMEKELNQIVFNPSKPSYRYWLDYGLTTLPENLDDKNAWSRSLNHHMYSNIIEFLK